MMSGSAANEADYLLYTKSARHYDRVRFGGRSGNWGHQRQISILKRLADDWQGKTVLEIGCGTGRITEMLARWGATVTATDISPEMLEVAQGRLDGQKPCCTAQFRVMSVFDIDMDLRSYDYIIMVNVFGRLSHPQGALQQIASKMPQDCRFVFTFPCLTSVLFPFGLLVNARGKSLSRDATSRWYRPTTVRSYCRAAGLEIVRLCGNHYVPVPRLLFLTFPFFWLLDTVVARWWPHHCPSVFAMCRRCAACG